MAFCAIGQRNLHTNGLILSPCEVDAEIAQCIICVVEWVVIADFETRLGLCVCHVSEISDVFFFCIEALSVR